MSDRKEEISYYALGGRDAEMYKQIDDYLAISKRFSTQGIKRTRRRRLLLCFVYGGFLSALSIYLTIRLSTLFCLISMNLFALLFYWAGIYNLKNYGKDSFIESVRFDNIIGADGVENVYRDFMQANQIADTRFFTGGTYLFRSGDCIYRIRDIQRLYIREIGDFDSRTYYATATIADESGTMDIDFKELKGFTSAKRDKQFAEVVASIEQMRARL